MLGAALMVLFAQDRVVAIIGLGTMGYVVAMFFVVFRAPDLALTQLVVETVTTVMFLLCFYFLPRLEKEKVSSSFQAIRVVISMGVGVVTALPYLPRAIALSLFLVLRTPMNWLVLLILLMLFSLILGSDTMLEILVFCIAGLGVYTLIKLV